MTLKELAIHLGLSPTTVSRALNGYPEVNAQTRERVMEAARELNYTPNQVAQRLATGRARAIGHVLPLADHQMINPIFAEFITGASEAYSAAGYDMVLSTVPQERELEAYRTMMTRRSVDGFILSGPLVDDPRMALFQEMGMPVVVHGRAVNQTMDVPYVDIDNEGAFREAAEHLVALGHRDIAFLNGFGTLAYAYRRQKGVEAALASAGLSLRPDLTFAGELTEMEGYSRTLMLLALPEPPTAIMTSSWIAALGVRRAVLEAGLRVGEDISVLTHDDDVSFLRNEGETPLFSAVHAPIRAAGKRCAELVLALVSGRDEGVKSEMLPTTLVKGRSTAERSVG